MSLRTRYSAQTVALTLLALVVLLAPTAVFGTFVRGAISDDFERRANTERLRSAQLAAALVDQRLGDLGDQLEVFVTRRTLANAVIARDRPELERQLNQLHSVLHDTGSASVYDARGILLASDPVFADIIGRDFSERDYFRGALASPAWYVSETFRGAGSGSPLVAVSFAMRQEGRPLGVVLVTLQPSQSLAPLAPLASVAGRELLLLDRHGQVIASTSSSREPLARLLVPGQAEALAGRSGTHRASVEGIERVTTYAPIAHADWALLLLDDPEVLRAEERSLARTIVTASVIAGLAFVIFGTALLVLYERTERQRRELARVNAELEAASAHKSEFLARMSHELRTPLNAILGFSSLLAERLERTKPERQRQYLGNISAAGEHLLGLINDVLDLARVESGRIELRPEITTVEALFAPTLAASRAAADEKGLTLRVTLPPDTLRVEVDPTRVRQILYNLLSNATKFTPAGGSVSVTARVEEGDLLIAVADTGIGIPKDRHARVFGTFERLHEGRFEATGTGLGLALTKRIVEAHGGSIAFESDEGRGSTFHVRLPHARDDGARGRCLLIVEDDRRDAELIRALAQDAGLRSQVVSNSADALAAIRRDPPAGIVLDLRLPDQRGEHVLRAVKADLATRSIPVVVVTVEDDASASLVLGADDHMTKPIDHARLTEWLMRISSRPPVVAGGASADPAR